ncbi:pseudouridine synthase [Cellulomonas sp. PhB143]|uniref:pseudouridine synthase n=1 Tax=Cellulomonas sp. PhB143 TaxID=2485186 RepID=UPI000F9942CD|nr:pseudouridine synthase [Cellulomonas sp. PhB143]ROS74445.1 23S rRNA pseudouridine2605 synthase [Cellulomonas sp. PhB143]
MSTPRPRRGADRPDASGGSASKHRKGSRPAGSRSPSSGSAPRTRRPTKVAEAPARDVHDPEGVRLQKVLAGAGLGSRRACEQLIEEGRVQVDGVTVRELGVRVVPGDVVLHVDGMRVQLDTSLVTVALNKPQGVLSTMHDPDGRPTLTDFVGDRKERLFHVGRLDADSEGLLLLTNDGELANRLTHPKYEVRKTYLVSVEGRVKGSLANKLLHGVELEDGTARVDAYKLVDATPVESLVEVVIHDGRNRIVRRMFEEVGHPVTRLVRTQVGPIRLGNLRPGTTRVLGQAELGSLMSDLGL